MKVTQVPFYRHSFGRDEIREIADTVKSGWVTTGKKAHLLEQNIAQYLGVKHTIAVNSCTAAMHLLLRAEGIGPGDEIITTPYTFVATTEAVLYTGATPVYCDIDYRTLNIDPDTAAGKLTAKTKAFLPVHIAGLPVHMDGFKRLARDNKIRLFDDAAHAFGADYKGKKIGSIGDGSAFSFYAVKNLTTGEGGMVATSHKRLAEKIKLLSLHAMSKSAWGRYSKGGQWRYDVLDLGYKYNLSDLAASLGLAQFGKFERMQQLRRRAADRYMKNLAHVKEIMLPAVEGCSTHAWHLFMIRLRLNRLKIDRDRFIHELNRRHIGTSVHFIPLFMQTHYRRHLKLDRRDFPNAYRAFREVITLPFFPDLKPQEIDYVCGVIEKICAAHAR
jgi:dTDP-4-amino-4,6-dideoxygalactose transaminase